MKHRFLVPFLGLSLSFVLSACAAPAAGLPPSSAPAVTPLVSPIATAVLPTATPTHLPPTPTSTNVPPTATLAAVPPTATSAPAAPATEIPAPSPTETHIVAPTDAPLATEPPSPTTTTGSTEGGFGEVIQAAIAANQRITSYRGESMSQVDDDPPGTWKGEVKVPDVHYTYSKGTDQRELITIGEDFYLKNSASGADEWFLLPPTEHSTYNVSAPRPAIAEVTGSVGKYTEAESAILDSYRKTESVKMDGMDCDVYTQTKPAAAATFMNVWTQVQHTFPPSEEMAGLFEQADVRLWLCADGYIHQAHATFKPAPDNAGIGFKRLDILAHIYDLDTDIKVTAPTNVQPFPSPTP